MEGYFLMPHPPIMVKEVGKGAEEQIRNTIDACIEVGNRIEKREIDTIILISPHGVVFRDGIAVVTSESLSGSLAQFGAENTDKSYKIDRELTAEIIKNAGEKNIGIGRLNEESSRAYGINLSLDHGALVPLYFIKGSYNLVHITYGLLSPFDLATFGECIERAVSSSNKKAVLIASGDLSHRLVEGGPYPFSPYGKQFDEKLLKLLEEGNGEEVFNINKLLINEAGECGLRSIYILLGALNSEKFKGELLSYEGPLGVGYGVMELYKGSGDLIEKLKGDRAKKHKERMEIGNPYTTLARKNLDKYFKEGKLIEVNDLDNPMLINDKMGVFVSLKINGELRGCIGTIEGTTNSVGEEIIRNSISSALNDPRFSPVKYEELLDIDISVDLLYKSEQCSFEDLDPEHYGVIVELGEKRGLLLPKLEGINTKEEQVKIAREKGGIGENEAYTLRRFKVERFEEI